MRHLTLSAVVYIFFACAKQDAAPAPDSAVAYQGPRTPAQLTATDFQNLRWLEGRWRGTEGGSEPFYEGYTLLDDSTMKTMTFPDSTFAQAGGSGTIALRGGRIISGGADAQWAVSAIDGSSIRFDPFKGATNAFTWKRAGADAWTATLEWRGNDGEQKQRTYSMRRVPN